MQRGLQELEYKHKKHVSSQQNPNNNFYKRDLDQALNREKCAAGEVLTSQYV